MKNIFLLFIPFVLLFSGCQDEYVIPNLPLTKGVLVEKIHAQPKNVRIYDVLSVMDGGANKTYSIIHRTPEMFIITIEYIEEVRNNRKIRYRSYYQVNPEYFEELQVGSEIDVSSNENVKNVNVW
jgi:hypothetical protein